MSRRLLRLEQIGERTTLPVNTLRWLRAREEGPPMFRLGRHVVAYEDEGDRWVAEQAAGAPATGRSLSA